MKSILFCNSENPNRIRYLQVGETWNVSFVVEFMLGSKIYNNIYWGNVYYVEKDRHVISELLTISFLPDKSDKWIKCDFDKVINNEMKYIIEQAELAVEQLNKSE